MIYQKATDEDLQGILDLQLKNFIGNLTDLEKNDGFLSVEFTRKQFKTMNDQSGIIVCKENSDIHGYLCTSSPEFNLSFALPSAMIALYPKLDYKGKRLDQYRSIVAGPWCIEREYRGKNLFINMWETLHKILPEEIELITTFISTDNTRSLHAAKKIHMDQITIFQHQENDFALLAARTKRYN